MAELDDARARILPLLAPGTNILAMGEVKATLVETFGKLFVGYAGLTKDLIVAVTPAGLVLLAQYYDGAFMSGNRHIAVDAVPWSAIQNLVEPSTLIQGDLKHLNVALAQGGVIQTAFFPGKGGDAQTHFHAEGPALARQAWDAARASGGQAATIVALQRQIVPAAPSPNAGKGHSIAAYVLLALGALAAMGALFQVYEWLYYVMRPELTDPSYQGIARGHFLGAVIQGFFALVLLAGGGWRAFAHRAARLARAAS